MTERCVRCPYPGCAVRSECRLPVSLLRRHLRRHLAYRPFRCLLCSLPSAPAFFDRDDLTAHLARRHPQAYLESKGPSRLDGAAFELDEVQASRLSFWLDYALTPAKFAWQPTPELHRAQMEAGRRRREREAAKVCGPSLPCPFPDCPDGPRVLRSELDLHVRDHLDFLPHRCDLCGAKFALLRFYEAHCRAAHAEPQRWSCTTEQGSTSEAKYRAWLPWIADPRREKLPALEAEAAEVEAETVQLEDSPAKAPAKRAAPRELPPSPGICEGKQPKLEELDDDLHHLPTELARPFRL